MKKIEALTAYEVIEEREIKDIGSMSLLLRHKKTGARIALLSNDDENKVFCIGFRTPPENSTGVPHIIEHTVLCGSRDFPVKDPFVELVKGSLNTFLNAMTYSDKTVYPVASCNDRDFQNLMHVYLDAVFYPNIYKEEKIFMQEGWHYEMEDEDAPITINGVVYNEMKGAFSSPDEINDREVMNSLFPDTAYGVESGGAPDEIPTLTYERFLEFHQRYYHPSNSWIYLYGNMDMAEKLEWLDENYLSHFDRLEINSALALQKPFERPVTVEKEYPVMEGESAEDGAYLSYNVVISTSLDKELYFAMPVLEYAICSSSAAPVKLALIHKNIGTEIYSVYDNGIYQPYFSIVSKNADAAQKDMFVETIEQELTRLVREGIDRKALLAGLNYYEFRYREADFGSYPKGLMYGLQMFDSWLYDDSMPFDMLEAVDIYRELKQKINTGYFESLIEKYLLGNTHKSVVVVSPKEGLTAEKEKALAAQLAAYKNSLSDAQIKEIVEKTKELHRFQEAEDSPEALAKIPMLTRADMKKEAEPFINELRETDGTKVLFHDVQTNGIAYIRLIFDASNIPGDLFAYIGVLKNILGYVDTAAYSYGELCNEMNIHTGGITSSVNTYVNAKKLDEYKLTFELKTKAMYDEIGAALTLMKEIMLSSRLTDADRILEILEELKSRMQGNMSEAGQSVAAVRAMSYFSETAAVSELVSGIPCYRLLERLTADFEGCRDELIGKLDMLMKCIFRPENLMVDLTATEEGYTELAPLVPELKGALFTQDVRKERFGLTPKLKNEAFKTSAQIQYVCRAGNYRTGTDYRYTGALRVLKVILGYDYFWINVRVKGGAYGCSCSFGKTGDSYLVSYRDPNLKKTIDIFEKTGDYLRAFDADERTMTKYIIGAVSDLDMPMTPAVKGVRSLGAYLSNLDFDEIQKERDELLCCTRDDIRALAGLVDAILEQDAVCVVGNGQAIEENRELFMEVQNLFGCRA
ncbi:MAG: insulinase family protein [Lachnospiraceae bacterium]|nr:insulinase family protein [Lachnospiraceae bacterium]